MGILDFAHAAEYLTAIGQTTGADGPLLSPLQLVEVRHALKHDGPTAVVQQLRTLVATQPVNAELASHLAYLETRMAQLQYPQFLADGWPIGSGMVEREQTSGGRPAERGGDALGRCQRQWAAGIAQCRV